MLNIIKHRLDIWEEEPLYWKHMSGIESILYGSSIAKNLIEIIKIRASQINKCSFCIEYHTSEALKSGELPRRIFALAAWQDSPLFSEVEKVVLQLTEEVTHISEHGVADETYEKLLAHFDKREIANLIVCICHINFLNRVGISTKTVAL